MSTGAFVYATFRIPCYTSAWRIPLRYGPQARDEFCHPLRPSPHRHRPGKSAVYSLLGQAYANLGNWPEAETWCRRAIERDRLLLDAYYTLSLVMQHQGKLRQAIENMKKVVYIDRNYILGHYGLATLYFESNLLPLAQKSLENALRLLQDKPDDGTIPGSQGITVGRLRSAITSQQQAGG